MSFDKTTLARVIYEEAKTAFLKIIAAHKQHHIYALALYYSGDDWCYLFPTVSTEKGLETVATDYQKKPFYQNQSIDFLKQDLRWSPCDSPLHDDYVDDMPHTQELLAPISDLMFELYEMDKIKASDAIHDDLVELSLNVLNQLQNEGLFDALDRESFTLNLICGDQSDEERLERARRLNPTKAYEKYKNTL